MVEQKKLATIGFIGYGYWGPNVLRNFYQNPRANILTACDADPENAARLQEHYPTIRVTTDADEVIADPDIDAICIATPAHTHHALARKALEADKHVFVEKPITLTIADADDLIELADRRQRILMVGHVYKYNIAIQKIKEIIDRRELGQVHYAHANRTSLGPRVRSDVNVVWDYAIHDLYVFMHLFGGLPSRVRAWGKAILQPGIEDTVSIDLYFPNDVWVHIHCSWYEPVKTRSMTIVGSRQMVIYNDIPAEDKVVLYRRGFAPKAGRDRFGNRDLELFDHGLFAPLIHWQEPLRIECNHFLACILEGKHPLSDGVDGKQALEVIYAVNESLRRNGEEVSLR